MYNTELNILIKKLDDFIRKYYKNQIIRGVVLVFCTYIFSYLLASILEYFGHFSILTRTIIFYSVILIYLFIFIKFICFSVLQFYKIGKIISYKQASKILSYHFHEIKDKIQNTLELAEMFNIPGISQDLVIASINNKISQIKLIPFTKAINLRDNYKYLKYIFTLIGIVVILLAFSPDILIEGATRIIKHNTYYEAPLPYQFILLNDSLIAQKGMDYSVNLLIIGKYVPDNVFISYGDNSFLMNKISNSKYSYTFKNLNNSIDFYFTSEDYNSNHYSVKVLPAPSISNFIITIEVPAYTKEENKIQNNTGDISVPFGSIVKWDINTKDVDNLTITINDSISHIASGNNANFSYSQRFLQSCKYKLSVKNKFFTKKDVAVYSINVIPDLYPEIRVETIKDSAKFSTFYFYGIINDDYGFEKLTFNYRTDDKNDSLSEIYIPISKNTTSQEFYYFFDFSKIQTKGTRIYYYFEVWDNDGINGSKSTKSSMNEFKVLTKDEIYNFENETNKNTQSDINRSVNLANELKKKINDFQNDMINKDLTTWEKSKMFNDIKSKQDNLEQLINQISNENQKKNDMLNSTQTEDHELIDKQKQIEELMKNIMNDDFKKLIEEYNKLAEQFNKDKFNDLSNDLKLSYKDMSKQLDKNLELLKKYEMEKDLKNIIENLKDLSNEQKSLSEDVLKKDADKEELTKEQSQQKESFNKLTEKFNDIKKENNSLQNPMSINDFTESIKDIKEQFREGSENMNNNKLSKASKNQQKNSENLEQLANALENQISEDLSDEDEQIMEDLKHIIHNVSRFSFAQEKLINDLNVIKSIDPLYNNVVINQKRLQDDFVVVKDSLYSLAKKTPQLSSAINKEVLDIESNNEKAIKFLAERNIGGVKQKQQFIMTSANNLALLLSEVLDGMEKKGISNCDKPGKGKKSKKSKKPNNSNSLSQCKNQSQSIKSQLESMIEQMKSEQGKQSDKGMLNKQLAQSLAQQEIFKKQLSDIINSGNMKTETVKMLNDIKSMVEQTQKEIANKNINANSVKRQDQIITRLLEAENSEYQREIDNKRISNEQKVDIFSNPKEIFKYKGIQSSFNELLNLSNIQLSKYYDDKYKDYIRKLNEQ